MRISDDDMIVALSRALSQLLGEENVDGAIDVLVNELAAERKDPSTSPILTVNGRVLLDLVCHPEASLQECADRLGLTSANVAHAMTRLVGEGWGVRTRVGVKNSYNFALNSLTKHRDIILIIKATKVLIDAHLSDITLTENS
jgi:DNA-binding MarR family transcriptional regulator